MCKNLKNYVREMVENKMCASSFQLRDDWNSKNKFDRNPQSFGIILKSLGFEPEGNGIYRRRD